MADRDTATHSRKHPQMQLRQGNDRGVRFKGCWWGVGWGGVWVGWSGSLEEELLTWRWPATSQTAGLAGGDSG